jgi:hypothetical protein
MRVVPIGLFLFWLSASAAQVSPLHSGAPKPFSITVDQPAYIGEPIWVHLPAIRPGAIRYAIGASGCNRLELMSDGKPVQRRSLTLGVWFWCQFGPYPYRVNVHTRTADQSARESASSSRVVSGATTRRLCCPVGF